jgi:hypothetical protein
MPEVFVGNSAYEQMTIVGRSDAMINPMQATITLTPPLVPRATYRVVNMTGYVEIVRESHQSARAISQEISRCQSWQY